jgi:hypothetical protein
MQWFKFTLQVKFTKKRRILILSKKEEEKKI